MRTKHRNVLLVAILALLLSFTACGGGQTQDDGSSSSGRSAVDPSGATVLIPENVESIVVLAPSIAETVTALGLGDRVIGYDLQSVGIDGLPEGVPTFDMVNPDVEQLVALSPDIVFVSSLALYDQEAPYKPLIDAGTCVICVPTSDSIDDVKSDIRFIADALNVPDKGEAIVRDLTDELDEIAAVADTIPDDERKSVYFEISAAPYMYSTGSDTYLNEMIELIGAENVLAGETGWLSVDGETIVAANPDVILTNVNYIDDPIGEILGRDGWAGITAVKNGAVYSIDNSSSAQPNQNIIVAIRQMAEAVYPEYYGEE